MEGLIAREFIFMKFEFALFINVNIIFCKELLIKYLPMAIGEL